MDHHGIPRRVLVCTNTSGCLHQQRGGADLREPRETWHPAAARFLSLLCIVCMCSLRLSPLSQKKNDPGSRFHFIRTDDFGNNFGNVLGGILTLFHTQKQILCRILSLSCSQKQIFLCPFYFTSISSLLYLPSVFLCASDKQ